VQCGPRGLKGRGLALSQQWRWHITDVTIKRASPIRRLLRNGSHLQRPRWRWLVDIFVANDSVPNFLYHITVTERSRILASHRNGGE